MYRIKAQIFAAIFYETENHVACPSPTKVGGIQRETVNSNTVEKSALELPGINFIPKYLF